MQTIKVKMTVDKDGTMFSVNNAILGCVWIQQHDWLSEVKRAMHPHKCKQDYHTSNDDAIDFVKSCIASYFGYAGVPVEFVE